MDIDATIADATERLRKAGPEPSRRNKKEYLLWLDRVQNKESLLEDSAVPGMKALCDLAVKSRLVYVTSREKKWKTITKQWLKMHNFPSACLMMRPNECWVGSGKLKETIIKDLLSYKNDEVIVVDDDERGDLEKVCKKNGWTFLKARSGGQH